MKFTIRQFDQNDTLQWNEFVATARNGLFLFNRSYLEYHQHIFTDHSLMFFNNEKLVAVFPANESEGKIYSHGGLTFGGFIFSNDLKATDTLKIMDCLLAWCRSKGFSEIFYKAIPYIYHRYPAQEDLYSLFRVGAELYRRDLVSVIKLSDPIRFSESKRQAITKCRDAGIIVKENHDFSEYWKLLALVLEKFKVKPVHSLSEINYLKDLFPGKIRLFEAWSNDELLAGIVIYDYGQVVHTQYMANSARGRMVGALDFVNAELISIFSDRGYYSFGTSTVEDGKMLNEGLAQQKEMMGGRTIVNDFYKIIL